MAQPYPHLLSPLQCGKFIFKNRMQSSNSLPHFSQGPEKYPADPTIAHFLGRAKSGAAFVTLAGFEDSVNAPQFPDTLDMSHFPEFDLRNALCQNYMVELIEAMHYEGTLVSGSLFSATKTFRYENEKGEVEIIDANPPIDMTLGATSMIIQQTGDEVSAEDLVKIAKSYGQKTAFYKRLGFDAVTLHMSYRAQLPGQLLSPLSNKRTDEFGGSFENRCRFPLMMLEEVKKAAGNDMLVEIQFSAEEPEGGYSVEEGLEFLKLAQPYVDIVQVRSAEGDPNHPIPFELKHTPFLELAARIKAAGLDFLVSNVGGFFYPEEADQAIAEGKLDLVAMARAWISNPDYGKFLYEDRAEDIVPCLRCNKCHGRGPNDPFVSVCSVNPKLGIEHRLEVLTRAPGPSQRIAVVGGGPAGMKAAIDLCDRGHQVTLFEQQGELGGLIRHADFVDFKWTLKDFKDYLIRQVGKRDIDVRLNTRATPAMIAALGFDRVIAALGSVPAKPPIPGIDGPNVISGLSAMLDCRQAGDRVVVIGGGEVGVEAGIHLAKTGRQVTVLEMRDKLAADSTIMHFRSMFKAYWEGVPTFRGLCSVTVTGVTPEGVRYLDAAGAEQFLPADTVVVSTGMTPLREQALDFYGSAGRFYLIGDCKKPGTVQSAMRDAFAAASQI